MRSLRRNTLHSSPFARNPLCLSAFRAVKSIRALFTYSSPLFTFLHLFVSADLRFFLRLEASCLGEEWWRVGEESQITLHPLKRPVYGRFRAKGEEWRAFGCKFLHLSAFISVLVFLQCIPFLSASPVCILLPLLWYVVSEGKTDSSVALWYDSLRCRAGRW